MTRTITALLAFGLATAVLAQDTGRSSPADLGLRIDKNIPFVTVRQ